MENSAALGIDLSIKDDDGCTAFLMANLSCIENGLDVVRIFMEYASTLSIDLNQKTQNGQTAFHLACRRGHLELVKIFMENSTPLSINLSTKDNDGFTPFLTACERGQTDVVQMLIECAPLLSIDLYTKTKDGNTAFHIACDEGHANVIKIIMENAATLTLDLNVKNNDGMTPFHLACINGKESMTRFTSSVVFKNLDVMKLLIENASALNINLNIKNNDGKTALHLACISGCAEVIYYLDNKLVLVDFANIQGYTIRVVQKHFNHLALAYRPQRFSTYHTISPTVNSG
jgi:ankyrin repeat protein